MHIVGIGGIGMSAIAEVMHTRGYTVQGSDLKDSANLDRLRARNIRCLIGHDPANLEGVAHLVISSAVKAGNPEFEAAKERGIPIIRRAEMLAELMRPCATVSITGTHGKTTTTSLIADLLKGGGLDPDGHRRRHHQWLGHQCPHRQGRVDGGRGRRIRRHLPEAPHPDRRRHQHRSRAYGLLADAAGACITASSNSSRPFPITGLRLPASIIPLCASFSPSSDGAANGRRTLTYGVARDADIRLANVRPARDSIVFDARLGSGVARAARACSRI